MQTIRQSLQGIPSQTQGTPLMAVTVGVRVGVGVGVPVMLWMVTQPAVLSQSAILTLRPPHRHRLHGKSSAGQPRALDTACPSGPPLSSWMLMPHLAYITHLLNEGDFFPTDMEAALKH